MSRYSPKLKIIGAGVLLIGILTLGALYQYARANQYQVLQLSVVQHVSHLYRSLVKLPDVVFVARYAFTKSDLERYELTISPAYIERMNQALPATPFANSIEGEKIWVPGYFRAPGYESNVQVKYKGDLPSHYNALKKSYTIKFPNDRLFQGMRETNLIIPNRREYLGMSLNNYRAEKLGLLYPKETLVRLEFNGAAVGVVYAFEDWTQEMVEKMPVSALSTLYGFESEANLAWQSANSDEVDLDPVTLLENLALHASDEELVAVLPNLITLEEWYGWHTMFLLSGGYHLTEQSAVGVNNLNLLYDRTTGRFRPIPYNVNLYTESYRKQVGVEGMVGVPPVLQRRIATIPQFREELIAFMQHYLETEREDDVAFVAAWREKYTKEFLMDQAKNDNGFQFLATLKDAAATVERNFDDPYQFVHATFTTPEVAPAPVSYPESFRWLEASLRSPEEVVQSVPGLRYQNGEFMIGPGRIVIRDDVVLPPDAPLTIAPGTTLLFEPDVSLLSYSPVSAEGTVERPIVVGGVSDDAWGVFAVLNTEATSTFRHVTFSKGGEATMNGILFSGMLAVHNGQSIIEHTTFADARGDDALNIKGGYVWLRDSQFLQNSSDGIDADFVDPASVVESSVFYENGGDAIDISWSDFLIRDNLILGSGDKGISVGERSRPRLVGNVILSGQIAVAVKDSSQATLQNNQIAGNESGVALYNKKPFFSGGFASSTGMIYWNNQLSSRADSLSSFDEEDAQERPLPTREFPAYVADSYRQWFESEG